MKRVFCFSLSALLSILLLSAAPAGAHYLTFKQSGVDMRIHNCLLGFNGTVTVKRGAVRI
jgi:hypothetical protein